MSGIEIQECRFASGSVSDPDAKFFEKKREGQARLLEGPGREGEHAMNLEKSCGAIVFTRRNGQLLYAVVQESSGAWSFPKGHMEEAETEQQTALREILEETGLHPVFLEGFRETDEYDLREKPGTRKQVVYFLAEFRDGEPVPRPGEILQIRLLPCDEAGKCLGNTGSRRALAAADRFLAGRQAKPSGVSWPDGTDTVTLDGAGRCEDNGAGPLKTEGIP